MFGMRWDPNKTPTKTVSMIVAENLVHQVAGEKQVHEKIFSILWSGRLGPQNKMKNAENFQYHNPLF